MGIEVLEKISDAQFEVKDLEGEETTSLSVVVLLVGIKSKPENGRHPLDSKTEIHTVSYSIPFLSHIESVFNLLSTLLWCLKAPDIDCNTGKARWKPLLTPSL